MIKFVIAFNFHILTGPFRDSRLGETNQKLYQDFAGVSLIHERCFMACQSSNYLGNSLENIQTKFNLVDIKVHDCID